MAAIMYFARCMLSPRDQLLVFLSTPLYIIIIGVEILLSNMRSRESYSRKDTFQNIYLMLLNGGLDLAFRAVYVGIILTFFIIIVLPELLRTHGYIGQHSWSSRISCTTGCT
ncbi:MAG: hypothetical protein WDO71_14270 [Bacteroidota bacterium]